MPRCAFSSSQKSTSSIPSLCRLQVHAKLKIYLDFLSLILSLSNDIIINANAYFLMIRNAFKMKLHAGFEAEYKKRHDEIWPELSQVLKDAGVSHASPLGVQLFSASASAHFAVFAKGRDAGWP